MNWKKATLLSIPTAALVGLSVLGSKMYRYGFQRVDAPRIPDTDNPDYLAAFEPVKDWFSQQTKEDWWLYADDPKNKIHALYLPNLTPTDKTVVIAHGYHGNGQSMIAYAKIFQDLGFNILLPDNRAHGESAGEWINFGWLDRLDYRDWCLELVDRLGCDSEIILFGVSMGGAIVMMMSGEELPVQVQGIIEDCGYSTLHEQLAYRAKVEFKLPAFPVIPIASLINRALLGFGVNDVNSLQALQQNTRPIFFIHGADDQYVPTKMCYQNFDATSAPKEMWIVPNADHGEALAVNPNEYQHRIAEFLRRFDL